MKTLHQMLHHDHPSHMRDDLADAIMHPGRTMAHRPFSTGGVVVLILVAVGLAWMWPEIQRYLKIERM